MVILNLGDKGKEISVDYEDGQIRLLNKIVEWRAHWEVEEDGTRDRSADGSGTSYTDPASGYGIHIAAATGDADDASFQRGHQAKKIDLGTAEDGPAAEITKLVEMALDDAPGLDLGNVDFASVETAFLEVLVTGKNGSVDTLRIEGQLAVDLGAEVAGLATYAVEQGADITAVAEDIAEGLGAFGAGGGGVFAAGSPEGSFVDGVADMDGDRGDGVITEGPFNGGKGDDIFIGTPEDDVFFIDSRHGAADGEGRTNNDGSLHVKTIVGFGEGDALSFRLDGKNQFNNVDGFDFDINRERFGVDKIDDLGAMLNDDSLGGENGAFYDASTNSTVLIFDDSPSGTDRDEIAVVLWDAGDLL